MPALDCTVLLIHVIELMKLKGYIHQLREIFKLKRLTTKLKQLKGFPVHVCFEFFIFAFKLCLQ